MPVLAAMCANDSLFSKNLLQMLFFLMQEVTHVFSTGGGELLASDYKVPFLGEREMSDIHAFFF